MTLAKTVHVVAAIIYNEDRSQVLLSLRKPEQHQGGLWEFPGGKVEAKEEQHHALKRELHEELGVMIGSCEFYMDIEHHYSDKAVHLWFWSVYDFTGEPVGREQQQWCWWDVNSLKGLEFPEANQPVVARLVASFV